MPLFRKHIIAFVISLAMFMEALDSTILNTAIPTMAESLAVNPIDLKLALIGYLLSLAIFIPISGHLADKIGIKRVFMSALGIFVVSSVACGFAEHLWQLVAARLCQGFGGALMLPVGRLLILRTYERHELVLGMNRVVTVGALGAMLGPMLGGIITHHVSWHWIFWANIPVGMVALLLAKVFLYGEAPKPVPALDSIGFLCFGSGLALLTFGLSALSESVIPLAWSVALLGMAVLLLVYYGWHSKRQPHPIVNPQVFFYRTLKISASANLVGRLGFGGVPFLLPLLLQLCLGYSVQVSGFLLAPIAMGLVVAKLINLPLLHRLGYKKLLIINTIAMSVTLLAFTMLEPSTPIFGIVLLAFVFGLITSLQYSAMNSLAYADMPAAQLSAATSIMSTVQQLAQSFGVAISALLLHAFSPQNQSGLVFTVSGFHQVFLSLSLITLLATLLFIRLKPTDGVGLLKAKAA